MKSAVEKALEARIEAQHNALEGIKHIVWTPNITMPQLRRRVAFTKLEGKKILARTHSGPRCRSSIGFF